MYLSIYVVFCGTVLRKWNVDSTFLLRFSGNNKACFGRELAKQSKSLKRHRVKRRNPNPEYSIRPTPSTLRPLYRSKFSYLWSKIEIVFRNFVNGNLTKLIMSKVPGFLQLADSYSKDPVRQFPYRRSSYRYTIGMAHHPMQRSGPLVGRMIVRTFAKGSGFLKLCCEALWSIQ
jgi:hypothetical protein